MENFNYVNLSFVDSELSVLVIRLNECYENHQKNFVELCVTIYRIWSYCKGHYFKARDNEMYNSYSLLAKFGFDKQSVNRYKRCYERYVTKFVSSNNETFFDLDVSYRLFCPSKLFELLALSKESLDDAISNKLIVPEMTVKQIRDFIKSVKDGTDKADKVIESDLSNEENIPMAFDPNKKYEYSYFETKSKNQLLNIVWELQNAHQKLLSKEKKIKNGKEN